MTTSIFAVLLGCLGIAAAAAQAQAPIQPVSWSLSTSAASAKPEGRLTLSLTAHIDEGWHVYALKQVEGGPTPLRITTDPNGSVQVAGAPSGTAPTTKHDASFDVDTEVFNHVFTLKVPVQVKPAAVAGEDIALNVRFQACNDHVCLPPRTVHLTLAHGPAPATH